MRPALDDLHVGATRSGCPKRRVSHRGGTQHAAVVREQDDSGQAEQVKPRHRTFEDSQVGGRLQSLTNGAAQLLRQVSAAESRRDGHLLDDRGLGATLITTVLEPLALVTAHENDAQHKDRHQAREGVHRKEAGARSTATTTDHDRPAAREAAEGTIGTNGQ